MTLRNKKIGVIGAGNIGTRIARIAAGAGMEVILNDPPLAEKTGSSRYRPLPELMECDIITLHVPMNLSGIYKTYHLFNAKNLPLLKNNTIFFNTSRGAVTDNNALLDAVKKKNIIAILDVWENEPELNKELLSVTEIATPHIAGYSYEGKINGTVMIYDELCRFAGLDPGWKMKIPQNTANIIRVEKKGSDEEKIHSVIKTIYDIREDDAGLRKTLIMEEKEIPGYFDKLRKNYKLRREFFNFNISADENDTQVIKALNAMRFRGI